MANCVQNSIRKVRSWAQDLP